MLCTIVCTSIGRCFATFKNIEKTVACIHSFFIVLFIVHTWILLSFILLTNTCTIFLGTYHFLLDHSIPNISVLYYNVVLIDNFRFNLFIVAHCCGIYCINGTILTIFIQRGYILTYLFRNNLMNLFKIRTCRGFIWKYNDTPVFKWS